MLARLPAHAAPWFVCQTSQSIVQKPFGPLIHKAAADTDRRGNLDEGRAIRQWPGARPCFRSECMPKNSETQSLLLKHRSHQCRVFSIFDCTEAVDQDRTECAVGERIVGLL